MRILILILTCSAVRIRAEDHEYAYIGGPRIVTVGAMVWCGVVGVQVSGPPVWV